VSQSKKARQKKSGQTRPPAGSSRSKGRGKAKTGAAEELTGKGDNDTRAPWFSAKGPVVRFALLFCALIGIFYLIYIPWSQTGTYQLFLTSIAKAVGLVLNTLTFDATVDGQSVRYPGFSMRIVPGCDAMEAIGLFGSAVLASPVAWQKRLTFACIGTVAIFVVNVSRLASLLLIGAYFPSVFETVHWDLWPGLLIVVVLVCWLLWARWATRDRGLVSDTSQ